MDPNVWPFDPRACTALLVIDMQRDFCAPGGYAHRAGLDVARLAAPIANIQRLLAAARARGWQVVHTREGHLPDLSDCPPAKLARSAAAGARIGSDGPLGRLLVRGEHGHDFIDALRPNAAKRSSTNPATGHSTRPGCSSCLRPPASHSWWSAG